MFQKIVLICKLAARYSLKDLGLEKVVDTFCIISSHSIYTLCVEIVGPLRQLCIFSLMHL